jgi:hypothetical protein
MATFRPKLPKGQSVIGAHFKPSGKRSADALDAHSEPKRQKLNHVAPSSPKRAVGRPKKPVPLFAVSNAAQQ